MRETIQLQIGFTDFINYFILYFVYNFENCVNSNPYTIYVQLQYQKLKSKNNIDILYSLFISQFYFKEKLEH